MKTRYKILIIICLSIIPISIFFPQVFLIFHLDKYETNEKCDAVNGTWDWFHNTCDLRNKCDELNGEWELIDNKCVFQSNEKYVFREQCKDMGGIPSCKTCSSELAYSPWFSILRVGCLTMCTQVCEMDIVGENEN